MSYSFSLIVTNNKISRHDLSSNFGFFYKNSAYNEDRLLEWYVVTQNNQSIILIQWKIMFHKINPLSLKSITILSKYSCMRKHVNRCSYYFINFCNAKASFSLIYRISVGKIAFQWVVVLTNIFTFYICDAIC